MISISKSVNATPTTIVQNSRGCKILSFAAGKYVDDDDSTKRGVMITAGVVHHPPKGSGIIRSVDLRIFPHTSGSAPSMNSLFWVSCSCPWFLFNCEVALTIHQSSWLIYSNGVLPVVRNPQFLPWSCVTPGTLIETNQGVKLARDVVKTNTLLSRHGSYHAIEAIENVKLPSVRVSTKKGYSLTCAKDKGFLVLRDDLNLEWVEAHRLNPGDLVAVSTVSRSENLPDPSKREKRIAEICGLLVSDGWGNALCNTSRRLLRRFEWLCKKVGWITGKWNDNTSELSTKPCWVVPILSEELNDWYPAQNAHTAKIPKWILTGHRELIAAFLKGYWEGDGHISNDGVTLTAGSVSIRLAKQLQLALLHLGIFSSRHKYTIPSLHPSGHSRMWFIRVCGIDTISFRDNVGAVRTWRKQRLSLATGIQRRNPIKARILPHTTVPLLFSPVKLDCGDIRWSELSTLVNREIPLTPCGRLPRAKGGGKPERVYDMKEVEALLTRSPLCPDCGKRIVNESPAHHFWHCKGLNSYLSKLGALGTQTTGSDLQPYPTLLLNRWIAFAEEAKATDPSSYIKASRLQDMFFDKVVKVKPVGIRRLINFSVKNSHEFIANGLVVHNCKHVLAVFSKTIRAANVKKLFSSL